MPTTPIVALDFSSTTEALALVNEIGALCRFYKVGSELFTVGGPEIVTQLRRQGCDVFLDLKFHDIPNTVSRAVANAARLGARLVTVHATAGEVSLRAAVKGAATAPGCGVLAVTVLTSMDAAETADAWGRPQPLDLEQEVLRLAQAAASAEVHGIVCSGREVRSVRDRFAGRLATLVPGLRLVDTATQDQRRVVTPREAASAGATYVVVGRAVTAAESPRTIMEQVVAELS